MATQEPALPFLVEKSHFLAATEHFAVANHYAPFRIGEFV